MADTKLSDLTAATSIETSDLVLLSQDIGGGSFASRSILGAFIIPTHMLVWELTGNVALGTGVDGVRVAGAAGSVIAVYMTLRQRGKTGSTVVDINKGTPGVPLTTQQNATTNTTIYTTQANRPTLTGLTVNQTDNAFIQSSAPDVTTFNAGDLFTMDVDTAGSGNTCLDLTVSLFIRFDQ